ncbi:tudor domain-containing protein 5-like isoform X2 [Ornithodoros turicata]|uniref:tudor domain-containing protein 5-like isoform X2 n=1 Tax=Ornithodoros turicata TaxID=34597 RepID=UPI003138DC7E
MTNPDIETVKAIIRALLIADKRPLTVRRFLSEYRNNEGHELPWRAFGFSNALSFLRSITDTVRVFQADGDNYIQATVTEEVEHVQKLVSRQKDPGSHSMAPRNFALRQFLPRPLCVKPPYVNSTPYCVPKLVKDNIFRLVNGFPDGINARDLEEAYGKQYGSPVCYQLYGFHSVEDFVVGLSDVLSATRNSIGNVKVVSRPGYCVAQTWEVPPWRPQSPVPPQAIQPRSRQTATSTASAYSTLAQPLFAKPYSNPAAACGDSRSKPLIRRPIISTTKDKSLMNAQGGPFVHDCPPSGDGLQSYSRRRASVDKVDIPQKILDDIQKVLSEHPEGVWLMDFMHLFELQPSEYGFSSILELLESYSSLFVVNRPIPDGDFLVCLTAKAVETWVPRWREAGPSLPASVVSTLGRHLRSAGPQGVTLNDLLRLYEGSCGVPLSLSEHGFTRFAFVLYLTAHLPLIFERSDNREFVLQWTGPIEEPPKNPAELACAASSAVHHGSHNSALSCGPFNAPTVPLGVAPMVAPPRPSVAAQEVLLPTSPFVVQDGLSEYDYTPVYVSQVYHPHHFYIQLKSTDTTFKLEALMDELEKVYDGHYSDRYGVEDKHIQRGFPCAAPYVYEDDIRDWHRAQVTSVCPDGLSCQVLYVDYGTEATVQKSDLRKLRNDFFNLPAQAIHAKLSHIKPASRSGWTEASTKRLLELTNDDRTLMCKVMEKEGSTYPIFLCDTTTVPERHVSDVLVDEGHAQPLYQESPEQAVATGSPALHKGAELPQRAAAEPLSLEVVEDFMSVLRRELDEPVRPKAVKPEYLRTGHCIMVVNIDRQPYLSSANVSELLGFPSDRVLQLLEAKEIRFPTITLDKKEHLHLFNQMASYDVPGVKQRELLVPKLTVFPLGSVNDLLNLFDCQTKQLRQEVAAVVSSFDPLSPYWQNLSDDSDTEDTTSLEQQLTALNARKIEICNAMMRGDFSTENVDELRSVEEEMDKFEAVLARRDQRIPPEGS